MSKPPAFVVRTNEGIKLFESLESECKEIYSDDRLCKTFKFSHNGEILVVVLKDCVELRNAFTGELIHSLDASSITLVEFSPMDNFLVTSGGGKTTVWRVDGDKVEVSMEHKSKTPTWPFLQWNDDETLAMRVVTNEVHFYDGQLANEAVINRIQVPGVTKAAISPGAAPYKVACFVPEKKGGPACVKLFNYNIDSAIIPATDSSAQKSFFRVQNAQLLWNRLGTALLIWTHADVDVSGKSYYGETKLYFIRGDGKNDCLVPLDKEGQIHDVQWSPSGREFVVVFGFTPAKTVLFNQYCEATFDFGAKARNTVLWAPHGRFLCIGGLGAMAGDVEFWDRNKLKVIGSGQAGIATKAVWGPDSRVFCTAVLSPRMRVDNGLSISTYYGQPRTHLSFKELFDLQWRPSMDYPDRPASPDVLKGKGADGSSEVVEAPKPAGVYRPPAARRDPNYKPSAVFSRGTAAESQPRKIASSQGSRGGSEGARVGIGGSVVVGYVDESKEKSASAKRRERRKAKAEADRIASEVEAKASSSTTPSKSKPDATEPTPTGFDINTADAAALKRRLRNLTKKLRQITQLRESGVELTAEQREKVEHSGEIEAEIGAIEKRLE